MRWLIYAQANLRPEVAGLLQAVPAARRKAALKKIWDEAIGARNPNQAVVKVVAAHSTAPVPGDLLAPVVAPVAKARPAPVRGVAGVDQGLESWVADLITGNLPAELGRKLVLAQIPARGAAATHALRGDGSG